MRVIGTVEQQQPKDSVIVVCHSGSPFLTAYTLSQSGLGTKFSNPTFLNGVGQSIKFSNRGNYLGYTQNFVTSAQMIYNWDSSGFGTVVSNASAAGNYSINWSPDDKDIVLGGSTPSPYIWVYPFSASGYGSKYADPGTLPSDGFSAIFSPSKGAVFYGQRINPIISAYAWSSGFGSLYSAPSSLPASSSYGVSVRQFDNTRVIGSFYYPGVYVWDDSTGWGTRQQQTTYNTFQYTTKPHPSLNYIGSAMGSSPYIVVWRYTTGGGFGTKFSDPATLPTGSPSTVSGGQSMTWSRTGYQIAIAHTTTPFITVYPFDDNGFGTKFSDPSTLPSGNASSVDIL